MRRWMDAQSKQQSARSVWCVADRSTMRSKRCALQRARAMRQTSATSSRASGLLRRLDAAAFFHQTPRPWINLLSDTTYEKALRKSDRDDRPVNAGRLQLHGGIGPEHRPRLMETEPSAQLAGGFF